MLALLCRAVGVGNTAASFYVLREQSSPSVVGRHLLSADQEPSTSTCFISPFSNRETYQTTIRSISLKFPTRAEAISVIYKNDRLISVNIFIVCKRQQNKIASGNSAFFVFFSPKGIWKSRLGVLLSKCTDGPLHHHPRFLARRAGPGRQAGHSPHQGYIFFFLTTRSDASDLLSDVAWMIQTKTNTLVFKNRS